MKKLLSVLLILSMLVTSVALLASCAKVSEKDMEKDPHEVISDSLEKSMSTFFSDEAGINEVLKKVASKGKYTLTLEGGDLLDGELSKITSTVYVDKKANSSVIEAGVVYGGETLSGTVYADGNKNNIAVAGKDILGSDIAILFDPKTFVEKFASSALADMMGIEGGDIDAIVDSIKTVFDEKKNGNEYYAEKIKELCNKLYEAMDLTVSAEKLENEEGKIKEYIISTYSITNENFKEMAKLVYDFMVEMAAIDSLAGETDPEGLKAEFDEALAELDKDLALDLEISLYVDAKAGNIYKIELDGTIGTRETDYEWDEELGELVEVLGEIVPHDFNAELTFTENEIALDVRFNAEGQDVAIDVDLTKEAKKGNVEYELVANVTLGSVTMKLLEATYEYEKNGDITIEIGVPAELTGEALNIKVEGHLEVEKNSAKLEIETLKAGDEVVDLGLVLSAEAVDSIPEIPADAKDVVDITESEWEKIAEGISNSKLGDIISSFAPEGGESEDEYDFEMYDEGYDVGYSEGYAVGLVDAAKEAEYSYNEYDEDRYYSDAYYEGYIDGYDSGYFDGYYGIEY